MPKISVIVPVYNTEKYLPDCLNSVLQQTFSDWEAICVNDGSLDNCEKILTQYAQKDKRIRVFSQDNQGVSAARNLALDHAKGDYICFLDSDDELAPTFLEKMYHQITTTSSDLVSCDFQKKGPFTNTQQNSNTVAVVYDDVFARFLLKKPKITSSFAVKLYRKSVIENIRFPKGVKVGEDLVFLYKVLFQSQKAVYYPEKLYFYRVREASATTSCFSEKNILGNFHAAELILEYFKDKKLSSKVRRLLNKKMARQIFKPAVLDPERQDKNNVKKWHNISRPLLLNLKEKGVYQPEYLDIKNRIRSYFFLKGI